MTRKQAVCRALKLLGGMEAAEAETAEVMKKLAEIRDGLPLTGWSEGTIRDALGQFAEEHGRNPTAADLKRKGMPPHTVIKLRFGMTAREFLHKFYPSPPGAHNSSPYGGKSKEKWTEDFITQFAAIKPESAEQYDRQRRKKSPSWQTIAKYNGKKRWTELLSSLGLAKATEARAALTVTRTIRLDGIYISDKAWPGGKPTAEDKLNTV